MGKDNDNDVRVIAVDGNGGVMLHEHDRATLLRIERAVEWKPYSETRSHLDRIEVMLHEIKEAQCGMCSERGKLRDLLRRVIGSSIYRKGSVRDNIPAALLAEVEAAVDGGR